MATSATLISLEQLADAALVGPDYGTVHFRILRDVLQIIINQTGISKQKIEIQGPDSEFLQDTIQKAAPPSFQRNEYIVQPPPRPSPRIDEPFIQEEEEAKEEELGVIEKRKDSKEEPSTQPQQFKSPPRSAPAKMSSLLIVPSTDGKEGATFTIAVTTEDFQKLVSAVNDLKTKYRELTQLSNNADLVKATRSSKSDVSPIGDMYQILTLTKRMEGAELGMSKLASMVEDLARESGKHFKMPEPVALPPPPEKSSSGRKEATGGAGGRGASPQAKDQKSEQVPTTAVEKIAQEAEQLRQSVSSGHSIFESRLKGIEDRLDTMESKWFKKPKDTNVERAAEKPPTKPATTGFADADLKEFDLDEIFNMIQNEFQIMRNVVRALNVPGVEDKVETLRSSAGVKAVAGESGPNSVNILDRLSKVEVNVNQCLDHIKCINMSLFDTVGTLTKQVESSEEQIAAINKKLLSTAAADRRAAELKMIHRKFDELDSHSFEMNQKIAQLMDEKKIRSTKLDAMKEQVEVLKSQKADKVEIEQQLSEKVDMVHIHSKVSLDHFDASFASLNRSIEDAIDKLIKQEEMWQQAFREVQNEIGEKLDKQELNPLKDFIAHKLSAVHVKMKALAKLKKEQEAAAAKAPMMKGLKCLSCDGEAMMRKVATEDQYGAAPMMTDSHSIAPYLAYELDQLRKQKGAFYSKNLHHVEQIQKGEVGGRHCGGGHTRTTPIQRVTRLGHFLQQWGTEVEAISDEPIKGCDGQVFQGEKDTKEVISVEEGNVLVSKKDQGLNVKPVKAPPKSD